MSERTAAPQPPTILPPPPSPPADPTAPTMNLDSVAIVGHLDSDGEDESPLVTPSTATAYGFTIAVDKATIVLRDLWPPNADRTAVREVSAMLRPGEIHGIVCGFGQVAEHFARVLGGFVDVKDGSVMANDVPVISSHFKDHVGFIGANWGCVSDVSVVDNLRAAVALRTDTVFAEKLVTDAAELLDITNFLDRRVDELSPGVRKRVAIAMEMVVNPSVLILVEPLEGLSCFDHQELVVALQRIAHTGRNVIVSMRSLQWGIFDALDTVLLIAADGRQLYHGTSEDLGHFLSRLEAPALSGGEVVGDLLQQWESEGETRHVANAFLKSEAYKKLRTALNEHRALQASNGFRRVRRTVPPQPSFLQRFGRMLLYSLAHNFRRTDFLLSWTALFVSFFACAVLQHRQHDNQDGMQNKRGIIFFLLSCAMYINVIFIEAEVVDRIAFVHLRDNRYFAPQTFFAVSVLRLALPRVGFSLVAAGFARFVFEAAMPLALLVGLTSFTHAAMMLLVVYIRPVARHAVYILITYYAYCVMFSGFLINSLSVPRIFTLLSLLRPGYGGAVAVELRGQPYSCDATLNQTRANETSYCYSGDAYLELQGFTNDSTATDSVWLIVISIILLTGVAVSMMLVH